MVILNRQRQQRVDRAALGAFARAVLAAVDRGNSQATITLVSDRAIRSLNRTYRSVDLPTDVLAFPDEPEFEHEIGDVPSLGDVVISTETAARYAARFRISFDREVRNLMIHGLLHLCGYDHETDQGEMKQLERRLRNKLSAISRQPSADGKTESDIQHSTLHRKRVRGKPSNRPIAEVGKLRADR